MDPKYNGIAWTGTTLIDVRNPEPGRIHLQDIARGLSRKYRFGGHTRDDKPGYSVAWHSLFCESVADEMGLPVWVRLQALLHDAPEYILGDMITPVKVLLPEYAALETAVWGAVARRFHIPTEWHPAIKDIDHIAIEVERQNLLPSGVWEPAPVVLERWATLGKAWIEFSQSRHPEAALAAALFQSRALALLNAQASKAAE